MSYLIGLAVVKQETAPAEMKLLQARFARSSGGNWLWHRARNEPSSICTALMSNNLVWEIPVQEQIPASISAEQFIVCFSSLCA